jgi:hypothetical protein
MLKVASVWDLQLCKAEMLFAYFWVANFHMFFDQQAKRGNTSLSV